MLRLLYSALLYVVAPLAYMATALRGLRDPSYRDRLSAQELADLVGYLVTLKGSKAIKP